MSENQMGKSASKVRRLLVFSTVAAAVGQALAAEPQCPQTTAPTVARNADLSQAPIQASAERADIQGRESAVLEGNVEIRQGNRLLKADKAELDNVRGSLKAHGQVSFEDGRLKVSSQGLEADTRSNKAEIKEARYQMQGQLGHGAAKRLSLSEQQGFVLEGGSFTTCPAEDMAWELRASEIKVEPDQGWGSARGAQFRIYDVPVFYVPYMTFPVTDQRKSGLLYPTLGSSDKSGLEYAQPVYWNIAPNLDLTFTPRYMSKRGLQLNNEFRYLFGSDAGELTLEYLDSDSEYVGEDKQRYLASWQHSGRVGEQWRYHADVTTLSDDAYFVDLDSPKGSATDTQITRSGQVAYFSDNWQFSAQVRDFEVLGDFVEPYRQVPQLSLGYRQPDFWQGLHFDFYSEAVAFDNKDASRPTANRVHLEPGISLPLVTTAGSLTTELKLYQTFYDQDDPNGQLADSVSRTLPQLRVHGQLNFERDFAWDQRAYSQTLEPQLQYLFIPKDNQDDIGLYDTTLLREDYHGLFRPRRFSGLDRITDANQITLGVTSRILDSKQRERLRASLGQIIYLKQADVGLTQDSGQVERSRSALAGELDLRIDRNWGLSSALLYDTDINSTRRGNFTLDYRVSDNRLLQFTHRYVKDISDDESIDQAGLRAAWQLDNQWQLFASHFEDLRLHRTAETYAGVQYDACCFALRLTASRRLNPILSAEPEFAGQSTYDTGFSLQVIIKGMGGNPTTGEQLLSKGVFSYREPYYLSN
ncbi:LPS assembly protein LptD [Gallaecimonas sp. GXIMD4217]|uniref:LPS assembly protein LptD n=1 Tax=Gallaecimonas sp. GXIMD4217 TaxID=3131927 RepID=UPI00311ACF0C